MNQLVGCSSLKYAVIETLKTEDCPECVVLAYPDEKSLRALIAADSILALGFISRDEAAASLQRYLPLRAGSKHKVATTVAGTSIRQREFCSTRRRVADWFSLADFRRFTDRAMRHALAATVLVFYSSNAFSATIRTLIGG